MLLAKYQPLDPSISSVFAEKKNPLNFIAWFMDSSFFLLARFSFCHSSARKIQFFRVRLQGRRRKKKNITANCKHLVRHEHKGKQTTMAGAVGAAGAIDIPCRHMLRWYFSLHNASVASNGAWKRQIENKTPAVRLTQIYANMLWRLHCHIISLGWRIFCFFLRGIHTNS